MARKYRKSKKGGKPSYKTAKKVVAKVAKKRAANNNDTFVLKPKMIYQLTPQQGVGLTIANYLYWCQPINNYANLTAFQRNAEFQLYALQYDRFRINGFTLTCTPKANVLDQALAQDDNQFGGLLGDGMIHTCIDRNGNGPNSITKMSRYPSYKKYSLLKPWSRSYRVKWTAGQWLNTNDPNYRGALGDMMGLAGTVSMYAENFPEGYGELINEPWATVTLTYDIVFEGKVQPNLTYATDASGNLTSVTMTRLTLDEDYPECLPQNVQGGFVSPTTNTDADAGDTGTGNQNPLAVRDSGALAVLQNIETLLT